MTTYLTGMLYGVVFAAPLGDGAAVELQYSGNVTQLTRDGNPAAPAKKFEVYALVFNDADRVDEMAFVVAEEGSGQWAWPERFGKFSLDAELAPVGKSKMSVLHTFQETKYPLALRLPLFANAGKLNQDASWVEGKHRYEVTRTRKVADRDCWQIEVSNNFGRNETLWVDRKSPVVVKSEKRVFMGRGDQFLLTIELRSQKAADTARRSKLEQPLAGLTELQTQLKREDNETKPELSPAQLKIAKAAATTIASRAAGTPFQPLATAIGRDVALQLERLGGIEELAKKFVGKPSPALSLTSLTGEKIAADKTKNKIVVLHFWDYQGEPLTEPYGQIGYLDFLNNKNQKRKLDVAVYGVAVDGRLADGTQRSTALRAIRKLKGFMNVGYPIAIDDGTLLRKFGDPRRLGAKLPLWVVIDASGNVAHYKSGFYQIDTNKGLEEVEAIIVGLIRKQREKN